MIFECSCILVAFLAVIRTFKLEYRSEFRRKIYIKNPKTLKIDTFYDDGSYVVQKDKVIGRIHFEQTLPDSAIAVDGHQESNIIYCRRYFIMSIFMIAIASAVLAFLFGILFYFIVSVNKLHSKYTDRITVDGALRNGMIMNFFRHFPYS